MNHPSKISVLRTEKNGNSFLYLPMEDQIKDLLSDEKVKKYLTNHDIDMVRTTNVISDTTSSMLYHEPVEQHNVTNNDLSVTWNTDGIPVFESSCFSIWPIQSTIN